MGDSREVAVSGGRIVPDKNLLLQFGSMRAILGG